MVIDDYMRSSQQRLEEADLKRYRNTIFASCQRSAPANARGRAVTFDDRFLALDYCELALLCHSVIEPISHRVAVVTSFFSFGVLPIQSGHFHAVTLGDRLLPPWHAFFLLVLSYRRGHFTIFSIEAPRVGGITIDCMHW